MRQKDVESFVELASNIEARGPYYPRKMVTEASVRARVEKDGYWSDESGLMLIVDPETDRILGFIVHFKPTHYYDAVELGYIVFDPANRGKGIVPQAVQLFAGYLFSLKPIYRIQLQIEPGNTGSRRVAEKCGFTYEGTARQAFIGNGKPKDIDVFSLLRSEFEALATHH